MWQSVPDGGAAHGGARLRFWVAEKERRERIWRERRRNERKEKSWAWSTDLGPYIGQDLTALINRKEMDGQDFKMEDNFRKRIK